METIKRAFLFLSFISFTSMAAVAKDKDSVKAETAYVNFVKMQDGHLFFAVNYNDSLAQKIMVSVYDSDGENLYRGYFPGKNFGKLFKAPAELGKLTVVIRNPESKAEHKFSISSETRIVRDAFVSAMQ